MNVPVCVQGNTSVIPVTVDTSNTPLWSNTVTSNPLMGASVPMAPAPGTVIMANVSNPAVIPYESNTRAHIDEDYAFARQQLYTIITTAVKEVANLQTLATASQHIRAYEALAPLLKVAGDLTDKLLVLQNNRQALDETEPSDQKTVIHNHGNTVFVGTTAELAEMVANKRQNQP